MIRHVLLAGMLLGGIAGGRAQTVETVVQGLNEPYGIGVDLERNVYYFTSSATDTLYSYNPAPTPSLRIVAVYPSSNGRIGVPDANPQGVAVSREAVVVALSGLHQIERRNADGSVVRIGDGQIGNDNGSATSASFNFPYAVAIDSAQNIYVADSQNDRVRKIDAANNVTTFATGISQPTSIALSPDGQRIAVGGADEIVVLNLQGQAVTRSSTLAANRGLAWIGGETGLLGTHYQSHGIGSVGFGNIFAPSSIAFAGGAPGYRDGELAQALFREPAGIARDLDGSILIADLKNGAIRAIRRTPVTTPEFEQTPGLFTEEVNLTLKSETIPSNSEYRFTLDKKDPTVYSESFIPGMTLAARGTNTSVTIKMRGFSPDANSSGALSNTYSFAVAPLELYDGEQTSSGGTFENNAELSVRTTTKDVTIRYTTNGVIPTASSQIWADHSFGQTSSLLLRGFRTGFEPSPVLSNRFRFDVGSTWLSIPGGVFTNDVAVTVTNITRGAVLRYTEDGSAPTGATATALQSDETLVLTRNAPGRTNLTLRVRGYKPGYNAGVESSGSYSFVVAPVTANRGSGPYINPTNVFLTTPTVGATIRYKIYPHGTVDPAPPSATDPVWVNGNFGQDGLLVAAASRDGYAPAPLFVQPFNFAVAPLVFSVNGGAFNNATNLSITSATLGAEVRYRIYPHGTVDPAPPTESDSLWVNGIHARDGILVARGFRAGFASTPAVSQTFSFKVAPLTINVAGGTFNNPTNVSVKTITSDATIRYKVYPAGTVDPAPPTESDAVWTDGAYAQNGVLVLRAFRNGFQPSDALTQSFTFVVGDLAVTPAGGAFNNGANVSIRTITDGASIRYKVYPHGTTELVPPTEADAAWTNGIYARDGILVARAFRDGFLPSAAASQVFNFRIAPLQISVNGGTFNNLTNVAITTATTNVVIRYKLHAHGTVNPPAPTANDPVWSDTNYPGNGLLTIQGFRDGFESSPVLAPEFRFVVAPLTGSLAAGTYNNSANLNLRTTTAGAVVRYKVYPHNTEEPAAPTETDPVWTDGAHARDGILVARAFRQGFDSSEVFSRAYNFVVGSLTMNPPGGSFNNATNVTIRGSTANTTVHYKIYPHGTLEPALVTTNDPVWADGVHAQDGILTVRAFRDGFAASPQLAQPFAFQVSNVQLDRPSGAFNNNIVVNARNTTTNTTFRYTLDGTDPTATSPQFVSPLAITANAQGSTNVTLKVAGFRDGFVRSGNIAEATYSFSVANPVLTPTTIAPDGVYIDSVTIEASNATANARHTYTLDGAEPTAASPTLPASLTLTKMQPLKVLASKEGYNSSVVVSNLIQIKTPRPQLSSLAGFFPSGTTVTAVVSRADAYLAYTVDGSEPTTNDVRGARSNRLVINVDTLQFPSPDLRFLKVRAFADDLLPSDVVSGEVMPANSITIPRDLVAGSGSSVIVPVVLNLKSNQVLRSVQFAVEVAPSRAGLPNVEKLRGLPSNTNDFVQVRDGHISTTPYRVETPLEAIAEAADGRVTNILRYAVLDSENFGIRDYGMIGMVSVKLPAAATNGSTYTVRLVNASGTEDGNQRSVPLTAGETRTITVGSRPYLVGDTAPGVWYNAGDFGDGIIDNADVLNAFRASLDLRKPFWFVSPGDVTDAFNAMDVFPEDSATKAGGLDQPTMRITMNDWQLLLERATSGEKGWYRYWTNGGRRLPLRADAAANISAFSIASSDPVTTPPGAVWVSEALIRAGVVENATPGQTVSVPVRLRVLPGHQVTGLQFRAMVIATPGSPALTGGVAFTPAEGLPQPRSIDGLPENNVVAAWNIGTITPAIEGTRLLGHIKFTVPPTAQKGACYRIRFAGVGGAPALRTEYLVESTGACVVVLGPNEEPLDPISDEWRTAFFERVDNFLGQATADPDNDGVPNWKEFLAGTHPLQKASRLALLPPENKGLSVALKFLSAPGKRYLVESAATVDGSWSIVKTGIVGDGSFIEFLDSAPSTTGRFYRIRLEETPE